MNSSTNKALVGVSVVVAAVYGLVGSAFATADADAVTAATAGGTLMADTMKAIALALIPLAIGVLVARKGWRVIKGFF